MTTLDIMELDLVAQIIESIDQPEQSTTALHGIQQMGLEIESLTDDEIELLLEQLIVRPTLLNEQSRQSTLEFVLGSLAAQAAKSDSDLKNHSILDQIETLYQSLDDKNICRNHLLAWLASLNIEEALDLYCRLMIDNPPRNSRGIVVAFQPFFKSQDSKCSRLAIQLFPKLLDAVQHIELAAGVLDIANYLTRESIVDVHPASDRQSSLLSMLNAISTQLGQLEQSQLPTNTNAEKLSEQIDNCVVLLISLCDALGLIGDDSAINGLRQTMELKHRRIQAEAAAALFRLGEEEGKQKLLSLLDEPVTRLRVIAYAEELGFIENIDDEFRTDERKAESHLAIWLAQPTQMGFAPSSIEVIDQQNLFWPGYDEPVRVFLLKYQFRSPAGVFENIGICGPMTYVFAADLTSINRFDQYSAFAGWQASHEDLYEIGYEKACIAYHHETESLLRNIDNSGYLDIEPKLLGFFFGEKILVCQAKKNGRLGAVIIDDQTNHWIDQGSEDSPICVDLAYCIYKGRRLLNHFNPELDTQSLDHTSVSD